ncbi:hypothetical protein COV15_00135 [Candidatus Woesearchaeota archaeon CG10_big_fil_rev_8_21_14_0_10_34_12]|nr:MAG: hypothetical protein COV15_00135 [Candidatus Woesearchaeota archaeon CG10_big_fil_rev_8_21_14_0_10_34_12]
MKIHESSESPLAKFTEEETGESEIKQQGRGYRKFRWQDYALIGATITALGLGYLAYCIKRVSNQIPEKTADTITKFIPKQK